MLVTNNVDIDINNIEVNYIIEPNNYYNINNILCQEKNKEIYYIPITTLDSELELYIRDLANELDIPLSLVLAIIDLESSFNQDTIGNNGWSIDIGLMQLNSKYGIPDAESILGYKIDAYNAYDNISGGIAILYRNIQYYKNKGYTGEDLINMALLAYNRGIPGANKWIREKGYYHVYVKVVRSRQDKWRNKMTNLTTPIVLIK